MHHETFFSKEIPYARAHEKTDLLNRPTSYKWIIEIDPLNFPINILMGFSYVLAQEKYIQEV